MIIVYHVFLICQGVLRIFLNFFAFLMLMPQKGLLTCGTGDRADILFIAAIEIGKAGKMVFCGDLGHGVNTKTEILMSLSTSYALGVFKRRNPAYLLKATAQIGQADVGMGSDIARADPILTMLENMVEGAAHYALFAQIGVRYIL